MRIFVTVFISILILCCNRSYAEDGNVNWDKIESRLYLDLKTQFPDITEAEIEQTIGYTYIKSDSQ